MRDGVFPEVSASAVPAERAHLHMLMEGLFERSPVVLSPNVACLRSITGMGGGGEFHKIRGTISVARLRSQEFGGRLIEIQTGISGNPAAFVGTGGVPDYV